jgi:hypothetical protein
LLKSADLCVTEPKRIGAQLQMAHERFTTVLQSLEEAVSVVAPAGPGGIDELLFANRGYRDLYGADARHPAPAARALYAQRGIGEVYDCAARALVRRARATYAGSTAATSVQSATSTSEKRPRRSSANNGKDPDLMTDDDGRDGLVARTELNQPLTRSTTTARAASRVRGGTVSAANCCQPSKTATQAQRAGNIIRRIRE